MLQESDALEVEVSVALSDSDSDAETDRLPEALLENEGVVLFEVDAELLEVSDDDVVDELDADELQDKE